ncbi:hypothetical protein [Kribbella sp. NPDC023855]
MPRSRSKSGDKNQVNGPVVLRAQVGAEVGGVGELQVGFVQ